MLATKWEFTDNGSGLVLTLRQGVKFHDGTPLDAQAVKANIDLALEQGYRVVISDVWRWSVDELSAQLGGMAAASRAPAIYATLHDNYEATPAYTQPAVGTLYELRRRTH